MAAGERGEAEGGGVSEGGVVAAERVVKEVRDGEFVAELKEEKRGRVGLMK